MRLAAGVLLCLMALDSPADERILSFHSHVRVQQDGSLEVTETITILSNQFRFKRGIYRDFPTNYVDAYGNRVIVDYEPVSALRNGAPENFFSEDYLNGVRTYFGHAERILEEGEHRYEYRYRVDRILGYFDQHDELYWNVTGNDWDFTIDEASAIIELDMPGDPTVTNVSAYTGLFGMRGDAFTHRIDGQRAEFSTTNALEPHAGLTVVVSWPKGFVNEPGRYRKLLWLLRDNVNVLIVYGGALLMFVYLFLMWRKYGRDPQEGLIVTRYEPPEGVSAASLRYVHQMYYDNKVMTAAIVSLAVKGYLQIIETDLRRALKKADPGLNPPELATGERELYAALFEEASELTLDDSNYARIGKARAVHKKSLRRDCDGRYFRTNLKLAVPALLVAFPCIALGISIGSGVNWLVIVGIVLMLGIYFFFASIMDRPTRLGRQLLDEMIGFRDYIDIAEKDELNLRNPPEKTPELFERLLPYALALGLEQRWAERFAGVLGGIRGPRAAGYQPAWFGGDWSNQDIGDTMKGVAGGLQSSISSSVTPPGSSSGSSGSSSSSGGFSGGGFSGGGGGGGGGGGW